MDQSVGGRGLWEVRMQLKGRGEMSHMEEWQKQVGVEEERGQRGQRPKDEREREHAQDQGRLCGML